MAEDSNEQFCLDDCLNAMRMYAIQAAAGTHGNWATWTCKAEVAGKLADEIEQLQGLCEDLIEEVKDDDMVIRTVNEERDRLRAALEQHRQLLLEARDTVATYCQNEYGCEQVALIDAMLGPAQGVSLGDEMIIAAQTEGVRLLQENRRLLELLRRVMQWDPAFPVEAGLLDEIGRALGPAQETAAARCNCADSSAGECPVHQ